VTKITGSAQRTPPSRSRIAATSNSPPAHVGPRERVGADDRQADHADEHGGLDDDRDQGDELVEPFERAEQGMEDEPDDEGDREGGRTIAAKTRYGDGPA
jgi:hypothetical protein